jgi:ferric-dicitrate binding protein FerR (iron transport regulator)
MTDYSWNLIAKKLSGELSQNELEAFNRLVENDIQFKNRFALAQSRWNKVEAHLVNKDRIWSKIENQLKMQSPQRSISKFNPKKLLRYAAMLAIVVGIGSLLAFDYYNFTTFKAEKTVATFCLPDGSIVNLKPQSEIRFRDGYIFDFNRKVILDGEGFFEISKSKTETFSVKGTYFDVVVYGTSFNFKNTTQEAKVILLEGSIKVENMENSSAKVELFPGQKAQYNSTQKQLEIQTVNPYIYSVWKDNRINFNNFSLSDLQQLFKEQYGKTLIFSFDIDLNATQLGGSAPSDDYVLVVQGLSSILHQKAEFKSETIILK